MRIQLVAIGTVALIGAACSSDGDGQVGDVAQNDETSPSEVMTGDAPTTDGTIPEVVAPDTAAADIEQDVLLADVGTPPYCPPPGGGGFALDDIVGDLTFPNCDGQNVSLHDTCGANATLIFNYYGW